MPNPTLSLDIPEPLEGEDDITDKQKRFIHALEREVGLIRTAEQSAIIDQLGVYQASAIIDQLLDFKAQLRGDKPPTFSNVSGVDDEIPSGREQPRQADGLLKAVIYLAIGVAIYLLFFG